MLMKMIKNTHKMDGSAMMKPSTKILDDSNCLVSLKVLVTPNAQYGFPTKITSQLTDRVRSSKQFQPSRRVLQLNVKEIAKNSTET